VDPYVEVKNHFAHTDDVVVNSGRGAQGLKLGKRMFAMWATCWSPFRRSASRR
jgi:hypothetical protein